MMFFYIWLPLCQFLTIKGKELEAKWTILLIASQNALVELLPFWWFAWWEPSWWELHLWTLFLNSDGNATAPQSMPDLMSIACSAFLLALLAVENKIEKLDLWTVGRSGFPHESILYFHPLRPALATCHLFHLSVEQYGLPTSCYGTIPTAHFYCLDWPVRSVRWGNAIPKVARQHDGERRL